MSVLKVVEIMASSSESWEDAAQQAVAEAARTLHNIRSFYIKEQHASVTEGTIREYRVTGKLTFELDSKS